MFSIVIPTYNHANFLRKALDSVLAQTFEEWEAIIIDNYSDDNTEAVVSSINDQRIKYCKIHNNGIIAASRNYGIHKASMGWICFLDSDDIWYPNKLNEVAKVINGSDQYDVICNDEYVVDLNTGNRRIMRYGPYQSDFYRALLEEGNRLSTSATVIRNEFLMLNNIGFDESKNHVTVEDYGLWLDLARMDARFKFSSIIMGEYCLHGANSSSNVVRHKENTEALLYDHVFNVQEFNRNPEDLWNKILPRLSFSEARQRINGGQFLLALKVILASLAKNPAGAGRYFFRRVVRQFKLASDGK